MTENFEELLNETTATRAGIATGQSVTATVVSIGAEYVFLDLGTRSEGMLPRAEVERDGELTVATGDRLDVVTISARDGALLCATRMGAGAVERTDDRLELMARLQDASDAGLPIEGKVTEVNKGGFQVDVFGMRAFCPVSQIDIQYCERPEIHVGQTYLFQLTRLETGGRGDIVLSRRVLLQKEAEVTRDALWLRLSVGEVYEGTVRTLQPYGAFVDIGGAEGLLHVSEISHARLSHPEEVLSVGQTVRVQIREMDPVKRKISLSLKSLLEDPWDSFVAETKSGTVFSGRVTRVADFGAFVELQPGIEGLVHVSAMKTGERVSNPRKVVSPEDRVEVRVLEIQPDTRRVSLSLVDRDAEAEQEATQTFRGGAVETRSMGTLGDLLGASLSPSQKSEKL